MKTAYILTVRRLLFVLIDDCFALSFFIPTATANETISNREENNLHDCYAEHQRSTEDLIGQRVWSCAVKFGYSEKATKFEKMFHLKFDATQ